MIGGVGRNGPPERQASTPAETETAQRTCGILAGP